MQDMSMQALLADPMLQTFLTNFLNGEITLATAIVWVAIAATVSIVGGAIGGILLARKDLGLQLSAMIGGLFGPAAVLPATILGLLALRLA